MISSFLAFDQKNKDSREQMRIVANKIKKCQQCGNVKRGGNVFVDNFRGKKTPNQTHQDENKQGTDEKDRPFYFIGTPLREKIYDA